MKKGLIFICCIFLSIVIVVLFGVLHNQFTFTISSEFFTKLMFERFGFVEYCTTTPRLTASIIGAWSTWWIGLISGLIFSTIGLFYPAAKDMIKSISYASLILLVTTTIIGLLGLCYGFFNLSGLEKSCCFPLEINNVKNFIAVAKMHSFSYVGGAVGVVLGVFSQIKNLIKNKTNATV